jgi:hypothetical protein
MKERLLTPKQRANAALRILRAMKRRKRPVVHDAKHRPTSRVRFLTKDEREIERILHRATKTAFEKASLNIDDFEDWKILLPFLAWAFYGQNPGRSVSWTKAELRQLRSDVTKLRSNNSKLTERECCEALILEDRYACKVTTVKGITQPITPKTLMRRFQQAKKLDQKPKK